MSSDSGANADGLRLIVLTRVGTRPDAGAKAVRAVRARWPLVDCLIWLPNGSASQVRALLKAGAHDVLIDGDEAALINAVHTTLEGQRILPAVERLARRRTSHGRFEGLLSRNHRMWDLFETIERVASTDASVLVRGETGTGKELVARAVHRRSGRSGRFVALNCAALPEALVDSELFGHEKGAFTGATASRPGLFRQAQGGTVFLDEIGDMPASAQQSLLRVLQERRVRPVGGTTEIEIDARVVAATNVPLDEAVQQGRFREDLFYRLDVIRVDIPPLRERPEDVVYLFGYFLKSLAKHYGVEPPVYRDAFIDRLIQHDWPGNVRELENFAERVVVRGRRTPLERRDFDRWVRTASSGAAARDPEPSSGSVEVPIEGTLEDAAASAERAYLTAVLRESDGAMQAAADRAGVSRRTLLRKLQRLGLDRLDFVP